MAKTIIILIDLEPTYNTKMQLRLQDSEGNSGPASDTFCTKIGPNDTVIWQLRQGGGIYTIVDIFIVNDDKIFKPAPSSQKGNGVWTRTVLDKPQVTGKQSYTIQYRLSSDGADLKTDPELDIHA